MKMIKHVEHLLRHGKKPKELVELGFPKSVVTRIRRQLKAEKAAQGLGFAKHMIGVKSRPQFSTASPGEIAPVEQRLASLESGIQKLETRLDALKATGADYASLKDIEARFHGTPALGLKHRFRCPCGASGFVALHIQCTKCKRETWWGWFPER